MKRTRTPWPVAAACLALGTLGGFYLDQRLDGQPGAVEPAPPRDTGSFAPIVERVLPAVVSLESKGPARPEAGFGSGFVVDANGVILTNYHVVRGAREVEVKFADGRTFTSSDIVGDSGTDLAIVRIKADAPLPLLELGDSDQMRVGDRVLAVGAPFGLTGSVTHGIVSGKSRNVKLNQSEDFLQTDAAINPGNSGGPLVNMEGRVIGITSAIKSRSGGFNGVGLAIASNLAKDVIGRLGQEAPAGRGYLGVVVRDLPPGVVVTEVEDGSPAAKGGFSIGDIITGVAGQPVRDTRGVAELVAALPVNREAVLDVIRDGRRGRITVLIEAAAGSAEEPAPMIPKIPEEAPPAAAPPGIGAVPEQLELADYGLTLTDLTPELAGRLKLSELKSGAAIIDVKPGGLAQQAGLAKSAVITGVDGKPVANSDELRAALATASPDKGAILAVTSSEGGTEFKLMKLPKTE